MKNEDFLDLLNEIDEKYIESANKRLEELHQYEDLEFGKAEKPQVIRLENSHKKLISFRNVAFATVAAAVVCTVTTGVFVKLNKPQTSSPNSGVTLSESSSESESTSSDLISAEPVSVESTDTANLYKNSYGGPSHLIEKMEIYKNTGNSYYADCTRITSGLLIIKGNNNTPSVPLEFSSAKRINFLSTTNESTLRFTAEFIPSSSSSYAQANVTVGSYNTERR